MIQMTMKLRMKSKSLDECDMEMAGNSTNELPAISISRFTD